jgi:phosphatidylserine decarboxylase
MALPLRKAPFLCEYLSHRPSAGRIVFRYKPLRHHRGFRTAPPRFNNHEQQQEKYRKESFGARLKTALNKTRIEWYTIPVVAGIGFLGATQFYKVTQREKARQEEENRLNAYSDGGDHEPHEPGRPKKRKRIRPSGPW